MNANYERVPEAVVPQSQLYHDYETYCHAQFGKRGVSHDTFLRTVRDLFGVELTHAPSFLVIGLRHKSVGGQMGERKYKIVEDDEVEQDEVVQEQHSKPKK